MFIQLTHEGLNELGVENTVKWSIAVFFELEFDLVPEFVDGLEFGLYLVLLGS